MKSVAVVTPTVGNESLLDAAASVVGQVYEKVHHIIVLDGEKHAAQFDKVALEIDQHWDREFEGYTRSYLRLPWNTGVDLGTKFWGHRIFAAAGMLVNEDIICFLDEDNTYSPNHVNSLVNTITHNNLAWAYSLRNICDAKGKILFEDNCESLGVSPVWTGYLPNQQAHYHIDTSAYAFTREFLSKLGQVWYGGYAQDRKFFEVALNYFDTFPFVGTGIHTLNYRLGSTADSAALGFFEQGNAFMQKKFNGEYPWHNKETK